MLFETKFETTKIVNSLDLKNCYSNCQNLLIDENKRNSYINNFFGDFAKRHLDVTREEIFNFFQINENLIIEVLNFKDPSRVEYNLDFKIDGKGRYSTNMNINGNNCYYILTKNDYLNCDEKPSSKCSPDGFYYGPYNSKVRFIIGRSGENYHLIANNIKEIGTDNGFFNNECGLGGDPPSIGVKIPKDEQ